MTAIMERSDVEAAITTVTEPGGESVHILHILGNGGDDGRPMVWSPANEEQVALAVAVFKQCLADGYMAYTTDRAGHSEQVREFDPAAYTVTLQQALQGG